MFDGITNGDAESEEKDLGDSVECNAENDIAQWPAVIQRPEHEDKLGQCVRRDTEDGPNEVYNKQSSGLGWGKTDKGIEGCNGDEE